MPLRKLHGLFFGQVVIALLVTVIPYSVRSADNTQSAQFKLCSDELHLDLTKVTRMRSDLSAPASATIHLFELKQNIDFAAEQCGISNIVPATSIAGLYVLMGDRQLAAKDMVEARRSFVAADELLSRFGEPSLMWLTAIEGESRAAASVGDLQEAKSIAQRRTQMVKAWTTKGQSTWLPLVDALTDEATICDKLAEYKQAEQLRAEARAIAIKQNLPMPN